jgi:hypothetical protein
MKYAQVIKFRKGFAYYWGRLHRLRDDGEKTLCGIPTARLYEVKTGPYGGDPSNHGPKCGRCF